MLTEMRGWVTPPSMPAQAGIAAIAAPRTLAKGLMADKISLLRSAFRILHGHAVVRVLIHQ